MRQRKKYELDAGEDWFASEMRREEKLEKWGSESLKRNAAMHRDHCDAEKLAAEHREHCAADAARQFHEERCSRQAQMPSQSRPINGNPQGRSRDTSGLPMIAFIIFFIIMVINYIY